MQRGEVENGTGGDRDGEFGREGGRGPSGLESHRGEDCCHNGYAS